MSTSLFVCWTIDWQDNYLWDGSAFLSVSRALKALADTLLAGKVTWLAEIDDLTDITRHPGIPELVREIEASGGETGIHIHHTSVDPLVRQSHYRRAVERLQVLGAGPQSYAAGMGNYINTDTPMLVDLGITAQRSYTGNYVNAALPSIDWLPPNKRAHLDTLFPPALRSGIPAPSKNPVACDWRGAPDYAGYINPYNYRQALPSGDLFAVPMGILGDNEDGEHQLHIQPRIALDRLQAIFDKYYERAQQTPVFVACYFHPYDLTERGAAITELMASRWQQFVAYQQQRGSHFVTLNAARETYEKLCRTAKPVDFMPLTRLDVTQLPGFVGAHGGAP